MSTRSPGHGRPAPQAPAGVRDLEALAEAVDALQVGVAVYDAGDESFRVVYLNRRARELAGPGAEAGRTFSESFPDATPNGILALMAQARSTGEHRHLSGVPTATGRAWDIDLHPVVDGSGRVRLLVMAGQEVTARLETQRRLEAMLASTEALWRPMSVADVARQAAEQAAALVPALDCAVALVPPGSPSTLVIEAVTADWMRPFQGAQVPFEGATSGPVLGEHRALELSPAEVQEPFGALMLEHGAAAVRVIPLTTGDDLPDGRGALGLLILTASRPGGLEPAERALGDELAKRVSLALHRAELLAQAHESAERLRFGLQLALTLAASLDTGAIMRHLLEQTAGAVKAERATLLQVEEDGVRIAAALDLEGEAVEPGTRLPILSEEFQRLIRERRPYVGAYDSSAWPEEVKDLYRGIRQTLAVPLVLADEVVGALSVSRRSPLPFAPRDTAVMEQIGTVAVLALRNARLFEAAEAERRRADQSIRRLRTGVEVADDLGRRLDRNEVVRRLLVHAVSAVGAERASLARVEGGEVVVEGSYAKAGGVPRPGTRFAVREVPLYERAIRGRVPVQSSRRLRRRGGAPGEPRLERVVAVPLLDQDRV
ncbi:MAG: GAF domain-containing protein, partial [Candidatus Dormibacterales bacterium]